LLPVILAAAICLTGLAAYVLFMGKTPRAAR